MRGALLRMSCSAYIKSSNKHPSNLTDDYLCTIFMCLEGQASNTRDANGCPMEVNQVNAYVCAHCRGVASLAFADGAGASGMVYSVGADSQVAALEASSGAQVLRFKASSHPLSCVGAAPGVSCAYILLCCWGQL